MKRIIRLIIIFALFASAMALGGCSSCIPQYAAPPEPPVSGCYPAGHDPYVPMDHNPSILNPWDVAASVTSPFLYGPPR